MARVADKQGLLLQCAPACGVSVRSDLPAGPAFLCGDIDPVAEAAGPEHVVVEDALGGRKPKRIRQVLDALERRGVTLCSVAQVLGRWGAVVTGLGAGDSSVHYGLLGDDTWQDELAAVRDEVEWHAMMHRGGPVPRRICVQGAVEDGGREPLYRHPVDAQPPLAPFTAAVGRLALRCAEVVGHPLNHVLVQQYADGNANISLHADKTLDIRRGSSVVNFSLGATRTMVLRAKEGDATQRIDLPHGSLFRLGWETNRSWQHGIHPDRRTERERRRDERRGERVSLTFRDIATFALPDGQLVGQGARSGPPTSRDDERQRMLAAFGAENRSPDFDWDEHYGTGFDLIAFDVRRGT